VGLIKERFKILFAQRVRNRACNEFIVPFLQRCVTQLLSKIFKIDDGLLTTLYRIFLKIEVYSLLYALRVSYILAIKVIGQWTHIIGYSLANNVW